MNREKAAWIISVLLVAAMALWVPGSVASRDDDYVFVRTLVDIHRQVVNNYVEKVDEQKLREGAIDGLLNQLDPYSLYVPASKLEDFEMRLEGSFKGVGIQLNQTDDGRIEVITPIDDSPAAKAGVMAGDIILKVNGESIDGLRLPEVIKKIAGELGTEVSLTVRHLTGEEVELKMKRQEITVPTIKGYRRNEDQSWNYYVCEDPKIAYVRVTQFTSETKDKLETALREVISDGMKGLILDLRFNPGGRLDEAVQTVDLFLPRGVIVSTKGRNRPDKVVRATGQGTLPGFPMIVLVNQFSASAAEIVAGSLMDNHRALVMGTRTYGKGSVQDLIRLDNKSGELKLTVAYYYLPSGRLVHRKKDATDWGVEPQISLPVDPASERRAQQERMDYEAFRRPVVRTTQPATRGPAPTSQPADTQLYRAVETMIGLLVLEGSGGNGKIAMGPATQPATQPTPQR